MGVLLLLYTIRYLRSKQITYQLLHRVKKYFFIDKAATKVSLEAAKTFPAIVFFNLERHHYYHAKDNSFHFLNRPKAFPVGKIDWNFAAFGKLWTYHLNYFSFINDPSLLLQLRIELIREYCNAENLNDGKESYPISVRGIEWIKFFSGNQLYDPLFAATLYTHYNRLAHFREYHLLGNHLLENGLSLLFAAHYFNDDAFYWKAAKILNSELEEQVLPDGAHFEKSPMYHCHLLGQLMSCIEMVTFSGRFPDANLLHTMRTKAALMLGWLDAFAYKNLNYPMFGDATHGETSHPQLLFHYAAKLGLTHTPVVLNECGYRKLKGDNWELLLNTGIITSSYQPGHIHADAGSFCMQVNDKPLIVDTGISTYERNERRLYERSTAAHNTIAVDGKSMFEIWSSFRVARRSEIHIEEHNDFISCGYQHYSAAYSHKRSFFQQNGKIIIEDFVNCTKSGTALLHLHFHPEVTITQNDNSTFFVDGTKLVLKDAVAVKLETYLFASGFNKLIEAKRLSAVVNEFATLEIEITK